MKRVSIIICLLLVIVGCSKKEGGLELEIINKSIVSLKPNSKDIYDNKFNKDVLKKSKTIITYKLTNNDNKTYFFNLDYFGSKLSNGIRGMSINKAFILFSDIQDKEVKLKYGHADPSFECKDLFEERNNQIAEKLNYKINGVEKFILDNNNFVIHPNETLYFEWFLVLPYGATLQDPFVDFDDKKEYNAEVVMFSDSTNYKKKLSRTALRTIKENGYKVYHGIIKSKNKVPIRFIE